ncbi:methyl-accepting chemotaxis protein [Alteromonadaceae bacterium M269]|nr:methyl-accepting chemotaxis protein [Alteromonadaceae bacterium M269]
MGEWLGKLCSPAKSLMSQFRYSIKFTIVSLIFLVPLNISVFLLWYEYTDSIRFTRQELKGLTVIESTSQELSAVSMAMIHHRTVGDSITQSTINRELKALEELDSDQAKQAFAAYKEISKGGSPTEMFSELLVFKQAVTDYSNLELDLELDTSYLISSLVSTLPKLQGQFVETASHAAEVTQAGRFTADSFINLSNSNQALPDVINRVSHDLSVAYSANADLRSRLGSSWSSLESNLNDYQRWVQTQILDPDSIQVSYDELIRRSESVNKEVSDFSQSLLPILRELLNKRIMDAQTKNIFVMAISTIAVGLAIYLFLGMYFSVTDNIKDVVMTVHCIADGDLTARIKVQGRDEMRAIAQDTNRMAENLEMLVSRISDAIDTLSDSARNLKEVTQQTIIGVDEQKSETAAISSSMSDLTAVASQVDENSATASESAMVAEKEAQQGMNLVERLQSVMRDMQNESSRSQEALNRLVNDSKDIGQVSNGINEIAEQTNLLALNAAIEAARAGEHGRGFAVVADEVRTLAKRTQDQTGQIHDIVSKLQQATQDTHTSMEQSREQMDLSVKESEVVGEALMRITDVIGTINTVSTEISGAATNQSRVTNEVANQVDHIANISESTKDGAENTNRSADQLLSLVETLRSELAALQKGPQ